MRYLGIDFGEKRIGVAVSDTDGKMAFPYRVVLNDEDLFNEFGRIIKEEAIEGIVIGESRDFKGEKNRIMDEIEKFKSELEEKTGLPVHFEPEFLTSVQAKRGIQPRRTDSRWSGSRPKRREAENEMHDASAAAIILQSFLDKNRRVI